MLDSRKVGAQLLLRLARSLRQLLASPGYVIASQILTSVLLGILAVTTGYAPLLLALAAQILVSFAFLRRFSAAFASVRSVIRHVKEGELSHALEHKSEDFRGLGRLGAALEELVNHLVSARESLVSSSIETVKTIALAMEARDSYTQGHCLRVRYLTRRIFDALDVSADLRDAAETAALLHDVGKIGIPDALLLKRGKLTADEYARIMMHVEIGVEILQPLSSMRDVCTIIRHHHERYDGTGYPGGLRGEAIPLASRVLAVADTIDAMRSSRPYRPALSIQAIVGELRKASGTQLDPRIVQIATAVLEPKRKRHDAKANDLNTTRPFEHTVILSRKDLEGTEAESELVAAECGSSDRDD